MRCALNVPWRFSGAADTLGGGTEDGHGRTGRRPVMRAVRAAARVVAVLAFLGAAAVALVAMHVPY
jgi:hypothetical protein